MIENGRLRHSWRAGRLAHPATLDDYANLSRAALALYEATFDRTYVELAEAWMIVIENHYRDAKAGGYFFTADDVGDLIVRTKTAADQATPAGNATLVGVQRAALSPDRRRRLPRARRGAGRVLLRRARARRLRPHHLAQQQRAAAGRAADRGVRRAARTRRARCCARSTIARCPTASCSSCRRAPRCRRRIPPHGKGQIDGRATAYVCRGTDLLPAAHRRRGARGGAGAANDMSAARADHRTESRSGRSRSSSPTAPSSRSTGARPRSRPRRRCSPPRRRSSTAISIAS